MGSSPKEITDSNQSNKGVKVRIIHSCDHAQIHYIVNVCDAEGLEIVRALEKEPCRACQSGMKCNLDKKPWIPSVDRPVKPPVEKPRISESENTKWMTVNITVIHSCGHTSVHPIKDPYHDSGIKKFRELEKEKCQVCKSGIRYCEETTKRQPGKPIKRIHILYLQVPKCGGRKSPFRLRIDAVTLSFIS